jgi:hypothetical protein
MQGAGPWNGAAHKEMSKKESEGHSSAASFIDSVKEHLPLQIGTVPAFAPANL